MDCVSWREARWRVNDSRFWALDKLRGPTSKRHFNITFTTDWLCGWPVERKYCALGTLSIYNAFSNFFKTVRFFLEEQVLHTKMFYKISHFDIYPSGFTYEIVVWHWIWIKLSDCCNFTRDSLVFIEVFPMIAKFWMLFSDLIILCWVRTEC